MVENHPIHFYFQQGWYFRKDVISNWLAPATHLALSSPSAIITGIWVEQHHDGGWTRRCRGQKVVARLWSGVGRTNSNPSNNVSSLLTAWGNCFWISSDEQRGRRHENPWIASGTWDGIPLERLHEIKLVRRPSAENSGKKLKGQSYEAENAWHDYKIDDCWICFTLPRRRCEPRGRVQQEHVREHPAPRGPGGEDLS